MAHTAADIKRHMPQVRKQLIRQENALHDIETLIQRLHELSGEELHDPSFTVHHPLNAYRFIRNHSVLYNETVTRLIDIIHTFETDLDGAMDEAIREISGSTLDEEELLSTIQGILRLHRIYGLKASDMADGNIDGVRSGVKLTAGECADIMEVAYRMGNMGAQAQEWLTQALDRVLDGDNSISLQQLYKRAARAAYKSGDAVEAVCLYSHLTIFEPLNLLHKRMIKVYMKRIATSNKKLAKQELSEGQDNYYRLCQGLDTQAADRAAGRQLNCKLAHIGHPLLLLQPIRMEERSLDPYVIVYHNFATPTETTALKVETSSKLNSSGLRKKLISRSEGNDRRSSKTGLHIGLRDSPLRRRIEAVTNLLREAFEDTQVTNYGVGGHYLTHPDYFPNSLEEDNRIATLMIYLSSVERGGATVFPSLGQALYTEEGMAVFWYNLHPDGTPDQRTRHADCPVLVGNKWIANVWIRRYGQELTRPCNLQQGDVSWPKAYDLESFQIDQ